MPPSRRLSHHAALWCLSPSRLPAVSTLSHLTGFLSDCCLMLRHPASSPVEGFVFRLFFFQQSLASTLVPYWMRFLSLPPAPPTKKTYSFLKPVQLLLTRSLSLPSLARPRSQFASAQRDPPLDTRPAVFLAASRLISLNGNHTRSPIRPSSHSHYAVYSLRSHSLPGGATSRAGGGRWGPQRPVAGNVTQTAR